MAHHGVDPVVFHEPTAAERADVRTQLGLGDRPYVAFLGTLEPRKNIPALIRAMGLLARERGEAVPALVLAGAPGWDDTLDEQIAATRAAAAPTPLTVLRPGYLPLEQIRGLLGGSVAVVYPSLGEGFGLPVLEAMSSGALVITTRRLALPEVGGDAVIYTDVDDSAIARAIGLALDEPERAAALRIAGLHRAATFTWAASAEIHAAAYRDHAPVRSLR